MSRCDFVQTQLLEHLYGLLSDEESLALIEHAGQCDDCRASLVQADLHKQLLGTAAKADFTGVRFTEPGAEAPLALPLATPAAPRRKNGIGWQRWAMAAAIFLCLSAVLIPTGRYVGGFASAQRGLTVAKADLDKVVQDEIALRKQHDDALAAAAKAFKHADQARIDLINLQDKELTAAAASVLAKNMEVTVTGPGTLRVGEPTKYQIETRRNTDQALTAAKLDVLVRDETTNRVVYEEKGIASTGSYSLVLGPEVAIRGGTGLALELTASNDSGARGELKEKLALARSSFITHLYTDKPMYQPGERVWWRSLTLDRFSLKPISEDLVVVYTLKGPQGNDVMPPLQHSPRLVDPQTGREVLGPDRKPVKGVGTGDWQIPPDFPGGEYVLEIREMQNRFPPEKRKFVVNQYQKPRLNKEAKPDKESYGPGSDVVVNVKVEKAEGGFVLADMPVTAVVRVDGDAYNQFGQKTTTDDNARIKLRTDKDGKAAIKFKLPAQIARGDASVSIEFTDGANFEAMNRPLNVIVNKFLLDFYPEGGDLVAGAANRVYFNARTTLDKPAAVKAVLVDEAGKPVRFQGDDGKPAQQIVTLNDPKEPGINHGNGLFTFTPEPGKKYELKIVEPAGIKENFKLPEVKAEGVVLTVPSGTTKEGETIDAVVNSVKRDRDLIVSTYCRGRLLGYQEILARADQPTTVHLKPARDIGGVYRVTVFEKKTAGDKQELKPVAERLVYRQPAEHLRLGVKPEGNKRVFAPGDLVKLNVTANTETGSNAAALLLLGVVDKSLIKMADERTARAMPTHFLLTSEVRKGEDLEFTDVLLDSTQPLANKALDLLLGTQGWRRFLESDPNRLADPKQQKLIEEMRAKNDADRLMLVMGKATVSPDRAFSTIEVKQREVVDRLASQFETVEAQLVQTDETLRSLREGREFDARRRELQGSANDARVSYSAALVNLRDYESYNAEIRSRALLLFGLVLVLAGAGSLVIAVTQNLRWALPFCGTAIAGVAAVGLLVLGTFLFDSQVPQSEVASVRTAEAAAPDAVWHGGRGAVEEPGIHAPREDAPVRDAKDMGARPADALRERKELEDLRINRGNDQRKGEGKGGGGFIGRIAPPAAENGRPVPTNGPNGPEQQQADGKFGAPRPGGMQPAAKANEYRAAADEAKRALGDKQGGKDRNLQATMPGQAGTKPFAGAAAAPGKAAPGFAAPAPMAPPPALAGGAFKADAERALMQEQAAQVANGQNALRRQNLQRAAVEQLEKAKELDRDKNVRAVEALKKVKQQMDLADQLASAPCELREYAHVRGTGPDEEMRRDFTETLLWVPVLVMPNGTADVSFMLSDSVTSFQIVAFGHTADGRLGSFMGEFESKKPFNVNAVLPLEVTANDVIDMPVAVENASSESRSIRVVLETHGLQLEPASPTASEKRLDLLPGKRDRVLFRLKPTIKEGIAVVTLKGDSEPFGHDTVQYTMKVVPEGFPISENFSDVLERVAQHDLVLPEKLIKGTLKAGLVVYPAPTSDLQKGLEGLLREPSGCFEQTSTTNYPNVMILSYLREAGVPDAQMEEKARALMARGYGKLISFECRKADGKEGYEWFGGTAPPHEALTAYGLLQFRDMQRVGYPVDAEMVERTRKYLLSRRDGKGGFLRNARAIDQFGRAPEHITNAYIVWAITESEEGNGRRTDLEPEVTALVAKAKDSTDPYFLSLVANSLINLDKKVEAKDILDKIGKTQKPEGYLDGAQTSITGSGGRTLQIEATALGILAWTKFNQPQDYHKNLNPAIKWIGQQRGGHGAFGSTQSTILALRALLAFTKTQKRPMEGGNLKLIVNGKDIGTQAFPADLKDTLTIDLQNAEEHLKPGKNDVRIEVSGNNLLPYTFKWDYSALAPKSAEGTPIRLSAKMAANAAKDGETVHLRVTVENTAKKGHGMVTAVIGIPAGLNLPENLEQLKTYARLKTDGKDNFEPGKISFFEVKDRELVLYWRQMKPEEKIEVDLDLICRVPGEYRGPASRAYLYYNADTKHWVEPVTMRVEPK